MGDQNNQGRQSVPNPLNQPANYRVPDGFRSVRVGDIERVERKARSRRQARKYLRRLIIAVSIIAAILVGGVAVYFSPAFTIESVEVKGADHLTDQDLSVLATIPQGTTLLNVDTESLVESVLRDSWVEDVKVHRIFPSTLQVEITERDIAAVVEVTDSDQTIQPWAISADGLWLMAIPDEDSELGQSISPQIYIDAEEALHITGVPYGLVPVVGTYCTDENVNNALAIVEGMTPILADQVKIVSATDAESTLLTLDNGVEIAFGPAKDIREKERICLEIMDRNPGKVAYINVRVIDRPTWRGLNS